MLRNSVYPPVIMMNIPRSFPHCFRHYWHDEKGATAIEYGFIIAAIALVVVSAGPGLVESLRERFTDIATNLDPKEEEIKSGNYILPSN